MQPKHVRIEPYKPSADADEDSSFPKLNPRIARNFQVLDVQYEPAPRGVAPAIDDITCGTGPADFLSPFKGLGAVSDDIRDLLPPECRAAFDGALAEENKWKSRWGPESEVCSRGKPVIDRAIVPFR